MRSDLLSTREWLWASCAYLSPWRMAGLAMGRVHPPPLMSPGLRPPALLRCSEDHLPIAKRGRLQATAYQATGIGLPGRFAQVKEEREARGTRSKTPGQSDPARAQTEETPRHPQNS